MVLRTANLNLQLKLSTMTTLGRNTDQVPTESQLQGFRSERAGLLGPLTPPKRQGSRLCNTIFSGLHTLQQNNIRIPNNKRIGSSRPHSKNVMASGPPPPHKNTND